MPKTQKPTEPAPERCMRCGHPKTEHVTIPGADLPVCPTAFFLLDTFQADLEGA